MNSTKQVVHPDELADAVDPDAVTLVLGAPAIGKSHHLRTLGPSVTRLSAVGAVDDEATVVVVDDFVAAVCDHGYDCSAVDGKPSDVLSLVARPGGAVLVTRPRSLDWLCQRGFLVADDLLEQVDSVVVVRTPPAESAKAIDDIRECITQYSPPELSDEARSALRERITDPSYDFENARLQELLGTVEATVTPAALLSLSKYGSETVLLGPDIRRLVGEYAVSAAPLDAATADLAVALCPRGGGPGRRRRARSPAVSTALALLAVSLADADTDWLDSFCRHRPLAGAAEAIELAIDLPPGTIEQLRVFGSASMRARIAERLTAQPETGLAIADARDAVAAVRAVVRTLGPSLDDVAVGPDEYGSWPLVGAWDWEGPAALDAAATERAFPVSDDPVPDDGVGGVEVDAVVDALDGGLVVLSGPAASGKRRLAANVATELTAWGATVRLPDLHQPDSIEAGIDATPEAVVIATYGGEPARILSDAGVRALVDWVADGTCSGALLVCDDGRRDQLDAIADRAGCLEVAAWRDRTEFELGETDAAPARSPQAVADDLLSAMGWPETQSPSRWTLAVESVTDQSTLAAIAGIPDSDLDAPFVGRVLAAAIAVVARTAGPKAASPWLVLVEDLVGDVGLNRSDTDGAIRYRGTVFGTAMAAVASEQPTADEWVEALAVRTLHLTNETAAPYGREAVGGDCEPIVTAFRTALVALARPVDGADPNEGALATVDQLLQKVAESGALAEEPGLTVLCRIYGSTLGQLVETAEDTARAEEVLEPVAALVEQAAATTDERVSAFVLGNSFASMFGAVGGTACPPEDLSTWVDALGTRLGEALQSAQSHDDRAAVVRYAYADAIGFWGPEFGVHEDRIEPWLVTLGADCCRTVTQLDLDDPEQLAVDIYGQAVRHVVGYRNVDRAELVFGACDRLVETMAASSLADDSLGVSLHAGALAAFADIEHHDSDAVKNGPYGDALSLPGSTRFEDWLGLYDGSVTRSVVAAESRRERAQFLMGVYCQALSTAVQGFGEESGSAISPRTETAWFEALTDRIERAAGTADLVADPVGFLAGVFGLAAVNWAAEGEVTRSQAWVTSLVTSFRACRRTIEGPSRMDWFDAFAETDAAIVQAVLTRTDVGNRTHDRLVHAVLSGVEAAGTAADNPSHLVGYVSSVFGSALALAVDADPEDVRFCTTAVVAAAQAQSFDWVDSDRPDIFERIYARALVVVGRAYGDHETVEEWLSVVSERMETTANTECPEDPAGFVAGVSTRAYIHAVADGVDAWRHRLDATLRAFASGDAVEDPAAFLERVYAGIVVAATTNGQPSADLQICVGAVQQSVATAREAGLFRTDDALVRTFSRAAEALPTGNPRSSADQTSLLGQALRTVGGGDLETAVFDTVGGDSSSGEAPK